MGERIWGRRQKKSRSGWKNSQCYKRERNFNTIIQSKDSPPRVKFTQITGYPEKSTLRIILKTPPKGYNIVNYDYKNTMVPWSIFPRGDHLVGA